MHIMLFRTKEQDMPVLLTIGEARISSPVTREFQNPEDDLDFWVEVDVFTLEEAPSFDSNSGKSNTRSMPPHQLAHFFEVSGLRILFLDKGGLMYEEPSRRQGLGCRALLQKHSDEIKRKLADWQNHHLNATAGFNVENGEDDCLARLLWLHFWVDWAIRNCKNPALYWRA